MKDASSLKTFKMKDRVILMADINKLKGEEKK